MAQVLKWKISHYQQLLSKDVILQMLPAPRFHVPPRRHYDQTHWCAVMILKILWVICSSYCRIYPKVNVNAAEIIINGSKQMQLALKGYNYRNSPF